MSIWNRGPDFLDTVKGLELAKQNDVSLLDHNNVSVAQQYKGQNARSSPRTAKKQRYTTQSLPLVPTQEQFRNHQNNRKDPKKSLQPKRK
jgi:hypothetical protein